jgi:hypothetical protein
VEGFVAEPPKQSDIENVFAMNQRQHMLAKLLWEISELTGAMSVWKDNEEFPVPIFMAFNAAVTAWHITDWLWQSRPETRALLAVRYGFEFTEGTSSGLDRGLRRFQKVVKEQNRPLRICREIANGSKHMRSERDPDIKARAVWHEVIERVGVVKPGDLILSLIVEDGEEQKDVVRYLIDAFGYWERFFMNEKLIDAAVRLPDKIIRGANQGVASPAVALDG